MTATGFLQYVGWQVSLAFVLFFIGYGVGGEHSAMSSLYGSLIAILPNMYFTFQAFKHKAGKDPVSALGAIYRGEVGKFVLVGLMSAFTFYYLCVHSPLLLFISLFVILMAQPLISVLVLPRFDAGEEFEKEID